MDETDKKIKVATFRFGVIADFVNGARLDYGEKERLINTKIQKQYEIPFSKSSRIARSTIERWVLNYRHGGYKLEALYPKSRKDKGGIRAVPDHVKLAIKELKKENPKLTLPTIVTALKHKKLISADEKISMASLYRYWNHENLHSLNTTATDKRLFEAEYPNDIWQSDVMYGPMVTFETGLKKRQSYLIAILDDHSRMIMHAEFYSSEKKESFLDCLRQAILKRGLPQKLYVDNGSCFRSLYLEQVTAQLGIAISHSRPYTPQGRGKIERWFRYVQQNFLQVFNLKHNSTSIHLLNQHLCDWVDEYNNREHGTTKEPPLKRYQKGIDHVRPAPEALLNYFRQIEYRRVKKDRSIHLMGGLFEVPVGLIDKKVELRFHPEDLSKIEVFFDSRSYGFATVINPHVNAKIGRDWDSKHKEKTIDILPNDNPPKDGELF